MFKLAVGKAFSVIGSSEIELSNRDYNIVFLDQGYEGKSNWIPFANIGALVKDSGINKITL